MGKEKHPRASKSLAKEEGKREIIAVLSRGIRIKSEVSKRTGIPYSTCSDWMDEIYAEWMQRNLDAVDLVIRSQLREIAWDKVEIEDQLQRSKLDSVTTVTKEGKDGIEVTTTIKPKCADPVWEQLKAERRAEERDLIGITKLLKDGKKDEPADDEDKPAANMTDAELLDEYADIANAEKGGESK